MGSDYCCRCSVDCPSGLPGSCIRHPDPTAHDMIATLGAGWTVGGGNCGTPCEDLDGAEYMLVWNGATWIYIEGGWCVDPRDVRLTISTSFACQLVDGIWNCRVQLLVDLDIFQPILCKSRWIFGTLFARKQTSWILPFAAASSDLTLAACPPCSYAGVNSSTLALVP